LVPFVLNGPHWGSRTVSTNIPSTPNAIIEIIYPKAFEDEIVLARCSPGTEIEYDAKPVISVAFGDIEVLKGEDIVARLREMVDLTQRIVQIFERYFF